MSIDLLYGESRELSYALQELLVREAIDVYNRKGTFPNEETIHNQVNTMYKNDGIEFLTKQTKDSLKRLESSGDIVSKDCRAPQLDRSVKTGVPFTTTTFIGWEKGYQVVKKNTK